MDKEIKKSIEELKYAKTSVSFFGQEKSLDLAIKALEKEIPKQVIKIKGVSSQACPICKSNVNWKYCSNCGQKLKY
ncbi:hypothetical protein EJM73_08555 [Clostridium botulinum]|uniref:hypothetical protein n=1 Tax=Clostridium botulinum TaxID=1491 RepID=UPI0013760D4C|nr:hypothetical protein [Clostridium botulinum]NCI19674.1 hypothetical protein [Clostridium botulinum]NCI35712.1 hypothetical protein [Clostridium botulinum]NCI71569.1 hypothetical protein [Clostridium botulinum]NDI38761.1 hypothetical protein [Clostridium botulinum]HCL4447124.1 hypothetical protein [Clostridium botulinum]